MLQWMGGSRRKLASSKKFTHNRQKQYFEQRKRQQVSGLENYSDLRNKRTHYHQEPQSLDVLSIINLAKIQQDVGASQVDSPSSKNSPEVPVKNMSNLQCTQATATSSDKISISPGHQNIPGSTYKLNKRKKPASPCDYNCKKSDKHSSDKKEEPQNEVSVLDLLGEDGPRGTSNGRNVPEAHVALSVGGLGKVGFGTPAQSPKLHDREPPTPPKPSRWIRTSRSFYSSSSDHGLEFDMMHDIRMAKDASLTKSSYNSRGTFDEDFCRKKNTKFSFSCMSPYAYRNQVEDFDDMEESFHTFTEGQKEQQQNTAFGVLEANLLDDEYDAMWNSTLHSEGFSAFNSKARKYDTYDSSIREPLSPSCRTFIGAVKTNISASAPYFKKFTTGNEYNRLSYDQLSPPGWATMVEEDSQDSISLLSEESCSSAAEKARSSNFRPLSEKRKERKIKQNNLQETNSRGEYGFKQFSTQGTTRIYLDDTSQEENDFGSWDHENLLNQWNDKAGNLSKSHCEFDGMLEPECISLSEEVYNSPTVASVRNSSHRTYSVNRSFSHKLMSEDDLFKLFVEPSTEMIHGETKSKMSINLEPSNKLNYENIMSRKLYDPDIQLQKPVMPPLETEDLFLYSSSTRNLQQDILFPGSPKQKSGNKDSENKRGVTSEMLQNKDSFEEYSISSNRPASVIADGKKKRSEDVEQVGKTEELSDGPKNSVASDGREGSSGGMGVAPSQLESCRSHLNTSSPVPSQVGNKEKFEVESKNGEVSYQVMLESYVLQLLCVQKVLMEASGKDDKKNAG